MLDSVSETHLSQCLYGTLAVFFSALFFPPGNDTAAFLASLATFGAGFAVRPLGALLFGRIGDLIGRKYTFLITIVVMGLATALVGILPTYAQIGIWAPILLVTLRLAQGLALGQAPGQHDRLADVALRDDLVQRQIEARHAGADPGRDAFDTRLLLQTCAEALRQRVALVNRRAFGKPQVDQDLGPARIREELLLDPAHAGQAEQDERPGGVVQIPRRGSLRADAL